MFIAGGNQQRRRSVKDSTPDGLEGGVRFGVYEIDCHADGSLYELGRGAMGVTYRATDTSLQRKVALKLIKTEVAERSADAREGFVREARAAAALRHKDIATVYQFAMRRETGQYFYAMELLDGATLENAFTARTAPFPRYYRQIHRHPKSEVFDLTNFVLAIRERQGQNQGL